MSISIGSNSASKIYLGSDEVERMYMGSDIVYGSEPVSLYAITKAKNPKVMAICYAQGWAVNENYMTYEEAAAVTSVGTVFNGQDIDGFDEFQYFIGLTSLDENAFRNCTVTSLIVPEGVKTCALRSFSNCTKLKNITLPSTFTKANGGYFLYNASSLNWIKCYATTAPTFGGSSNLSSVKTGGTLYHPIGSDYSSWFSLRLTSRNWQDVTF